MAYHVGQQAVVIGGSTAGLMTARVLADHFDTVTVLERDHVDDQPALRRSIPQGSHLHGLLLGGQQVMASLYPGFLKELEALGAARCRSGTEVAFYLPTGKAFSMTGTVQEPRDPPKLHDLIKDAERVADITTYRFPTSLRHHYERLTTFPEGLVVLGDAISSVNPFYGQGMSASALQAQALQQILSERTAGARGLDGLAGDFFPKAAAIVERPWTLAALRDFAYPRTRGNGLLAWKNRLSISPTWMLSPLMTEVLNLAKPFSSMQEESLRSRVEAYRRRH